MIPAKPDAQERLNLSDLLDIGVLRQMLDWFTSTTGMSAAVRDLSGNLIVGMEPANGFCEMLARSPAGRQRCEESSRRAVQRAIEVGQVVEESCHAGLTRIAAPVKVAERCVGAIVIGEWVERDLARDGVERLAGDLGLDPAALAARAADLPPRSGRDKRRPAVILQSIANAVAGLCYQGYQLRERLREISRLHDTSRILISTLDLSEVLHLISKNATDLLGVKGCSIRLLDKRGEELVVKSWYNLSQRYRNKGPVHLERSVIDQAALRGELVEIPDMAHDPRVLYPAEAVQEGIASGAAVGLLSKGRPIGTLHVYSSEKRRLSDRERQILQSLAAIAAVAIENAQLYSDSRELAEVDRELRVAGEIQRQLLPAAPPEIPGYQLAAAAVPSRQVGGDFHDFIPLGEDRWGLAIADVVGKGVPGAILMATARALLRAHADPRRRPAEVMERANRLLCLDVKPDQFVTACYAVLDARVGELTCCNAGHNPPLLFRGDRVIELQRGGLVLGALEGEVYEEEKTLLTAGDVLVFYTDGLTEAESRRNQFFGRPRLERTVRRFQARSARHILRGVRDALRAFTLGTQPSDDFTAFVLKCGS
jgi:sigma-B regulation protein RsbU (phosphoserine phosphatase)